MRSIKWGKGGTRGTDRIFGVAHFTPRPPGRSAHRPPHGTGAVHRHSSVHRSTRSHIPDGNSTEATRPHVRLSAVSPSRYALSSPLAGNVRLCVRLRPTDPRVPRHCEGVALPGASLQSRSPTLTPPRPNARPANPALSGLRRAHLTVRLLWAPMPALPPPRGIQVSGRNAVQLRSCGGRIRRFFGRLAHRRSLRPARAKCGVTPSVEPRMPSPQKACKLATTLS